MVRWLYDFHESLPEDVAVSYFMEANFMQDIILDEFAREGDLRGYQLPIMPDRRKKPRASCNASRPSLPSGSADWSTTMRPSATTQT